MNVDPSLTENFSEILPWIDGMQGGLPHMPLPAPDEDPNDYPFFMKLSSGCWIVSTHGVSLSREVSFQGIRKCNFASFI